MSRKKGIPNKKKISKPIEKIADELIDESLEEIVEKPVIVEKTIEVSIKPESAEHKRVRLIYENFKAQNPVQWEREKYALLAKLEKL